MKTKMEIYIYNDQVHTFDVAGCQIKEKRNRFIATNCQLQAKHNVSMPYSSYTFD